MKEFFDDLSSRAEHVEKAIVLLITKQGSEVVVSSPTVNLYALNKFKIMLNREIKQRTEELNQ